MGKQKNSGNSGKVADSNAAKIAASEAGRARKHAANHLREEVRERARQLESERVADNLARLRAEQLDDRVDIAIACENIFHGVEGVYHIFGVAVRVHTVKYLNGASIQVMELLDALPETNILTISEFGTYVPISVLRSDPARITWRSETAKGVAEYLHVCTRFGDIARELRRQHAAEMAAALQPRRPEKPQKQKRSAQPRPFSAEFLTQAGLWEMSDGAIVTTWDNPSGAHCAGIFAVSDNSHPLAGYGKYIKTVHLQFPENGSFGSELREYLRNELTKVTSAMAA